MNVSKMERWLHLGDEEGASWKRFRRRNWWGQPSFPSFRTEAWCAQEEASTIHDQVLLRQQHFEGIDLQCALAHLHLSSSFILREAQEGKRNDLFLEGRADMPGSWDESLHFPLPGPVYVLLCAADVSPIWMPQRMPMDFSARFSPTYTWPFTQWIIFRVIMLSDVHHISESKERLTRLESWHSFCNIKRKKEPSR